MGTPVAVFSFKVQHRAGCVHETKDELSIQEWSDGPRPKKEGEVSGPDCHTLQIESASTRIYYTDNC